MEQSLLGRTSSYGDDQSPRRASPISCSLLRHRALSQPSARCCPLEADEGGPVCPGRSSRGFVSTTQRFQRKHISAIVGYFFSCRATNQTIVERQLSISRHVARLFKDRFLRMFVGLKFVKLELKRKTYFISGSLNPKKWLTNTRDQYT